MKTYQNGNNDQPTTCPKCGSRTDFESMTHHHDENRVQQLHQCIGCEHQFILEL